MENQSTVKGDEINGTPLATSAPAGEKSKNDQAYEKLTSSFLERLVELLESGKPLTFESGVVKSAKVFGVRAHNMMSGRAYNGINAFVAMLTRMSEGYVVPAFATFNQIKKAGGAVKKGASGTPIMFFSYLVKNSAGEIIKKPSAADMEDSENTKIPLVRLSTVFNLDQTTGLERFYARYGTTPPKVVNADDQEASEASADGVVFEVAADEFDGFIEPQDVIRKIYEKYQAQVKKQLGTETVFADIPYAFMSPSKNRISMPNEFETIEHEVGTYFHESMHATENPLGFHANDEPPIMGNDPYARGEIRAEIGTFMLSSIMGVGMEKDTYHLENSAAYIKSYLDDINEDDLPKLMARLAGAAEKGSSLIVDDPDFLNQVRAIHSGVDADALPDYMQLIAAEFEDFASGDIDDDLPPAVIRTAKPAAQDEDAAIDRALAMASATKEESEDAPLPASGVIKTSTDDGLDERTQTQKKQSADLFNF